MPVADTFQRAARWDSVGLDCSSCRHFAGPEQWPDTQRVSCCKLHSLSLAIEIGEDGHKKWEWFCRDFANKDAFPPAVQHFLSIRAELEAGILYRLYRTGGCLLEYRFADLQHGHTTDHCG